MLYWWNPCGVAQVQSSVMLKAANRLLVAHPQLTTAKHGKPSLTMSCKSFASIFRQVSVVVQLNVMDFMD